MAFAFYGFCDDNDDDDDENNNNKKNWKNDKNNGIHNGLIFLVCTVDCVVVGARW